MPNARKKQSERVTPKKKSKALIKMRQHDVLGLYAGGMVPAAIAEHLNIRLTDVTRDLRIAVDELVKEYAKPTPEQTFVRYAAFQFGIIQKLEDAAALFMGDPRSKQYNALISSLKTQSDVFDRIFAKGVEFGVIQQKKASDIIRKRPQDVRQELRLEIAKLSTLLDEIDDSTQARAIRATQTTITYAVRIRKPLRSEFGIVRATPDWKYRTKLYTPDGNPIPLSQITPEQRKQLAASNIDKQLHNELQQEQYKRQQQQQQSYIDVDPDTGETLQDISKPDANRDDAPVSNVDPSSQVAWLVPPT